MVESPLVGAPLMGDARGTGLHVMSFNVRRRIRHLSKQSPDLWSRRMPAVRRMLHLERPTVLGVQEALPDQVDFVLDSLGSTYRAIGLGRAADGGGERCPILYDSRHLELLGWSQQALSATPQVAGSSTWGNMIPRIVVTGRFRDWATRSEFTFVNTHLDHVSRGSRLRSSEAISAIAAAAASVIVVGDFNTDAGSPPYLHLTRDGVLRDSWDTAEHRCTPEWGTYHRYRAPREGARRIDWILATPSVAVRLAGINVTTYDGAWPSDHAPVQAVVEL